MRIPITGMERNFTGFISNFAFAHVRKILFYNLFLFSFLTFPSSHERFGTKRNDK
uniref:Uncharacterized protein n=1 Tax=Octopus bimaculoides TaxID=37653 RepID=A0A0L8FSF9_OCTBM